MCHGLHVKVKGQFLNFYVYFYFMCMGVPGLMDGNHAYSVPEKARRGCQSPLGLQLQTVVSCLVGDGG